MCRLCLTIRNSCYFDYSSRCSICVLCCHVISAAYYVRKGSWEVYFNYPQISEVRNPITWIIKKCEEIMFFFFFLLILLQSDAQPILNKIFIKKKKKEANNTQTPIFLLITYDITDTTAVVYIIYCFIRGFQLHHIPAHTTLIQWLTATTGPVRSGCVRVIVAMVVSPLAVTHCLCVKHRGPEITVNFLYKTIKVYWFKIIAYEEQRK